MVVANIQKKGERHPCRSTTPNLPIVNQNLLIGKTLMVKVLIYKKTRRTKQTSGKLFF